MGQRGVSKDRCASQTRRGEIQWGDETGLRSDDVRGRGYAPKGKTPVVLANANRSKLSVISTVTNKGQMRWKVSVRRSHLDQGQLSVER